MVLTRKQLRAQRRRPLRRLMTIGLLLAVAAMLLSAVAAQAKQLTVFSCHTPAGVLTGIEGWTVSTTGQAYMFAKDTCATEDSGYIGMEVGANPSGYGNGAGIGWTFTAPSWATIAKYTIDVAGSDTYQSEAGIDGEAVIYASDETGSYDYHNLDGGLWGTQTVERTPPDAVHWLAAGASCDGEGGPCPANTLISRLRLSSATILLNDNSVPSVSSLAGSLVGGSTVRGTAEASFRAEDEGPGVYSAWLVVDGESQPAVVIDTNNGLCKDLGGTSNGTRAFSSPTPCAESANASIALHTSHLKDGKHTVKLMVDDAAGNETTAFNSTVTTQNAPEDSTAPAIVSAQPQVGASLASQPGEWTAPQGAGSITESYQWESCNSAGQACQPIAGAESATYTPAPSNVGDTLRVAVTAADSDGHTTAASPASAVVQAPSGSLGASPGPGTPSSPPASATPAPTSSPPGSTTPPVQASPPVSTQVLEAVIRLGVRHRITRSFAHRALRLRGRLLSRTGVPIAHVKLAIRQRLVGRKRWRLIAHARTGAKGAFRTHIRTGPSRLIEVTYKGAAEQGDAAVAKVHERVRAGIRLHIRPRKTSAHGKIVLQGRVLGRVPKHGVLVVLMVHYRGKWVPFRDPQTNGKGHFKVTYQFQGSVGRFPFRAVAPGGQARFSFVRGRSKVIHVRTN